MDDPFVGHGKTIKHDEEKPRFTDGRFVSLGDGPKQVLGVEGLLLAIEESHKYPGNLIYVMATKDEILKVSGNRFLNDKVKEIGALYRITYTGKSVSKAGRSFKTFDILTVDAASVEKGGFAKDYKSLGTAEGDEGEDLSF